MKQNQKYRQSVTCLQLKVKYFPININQANAYWRILLNFHTLFDLTKRTESAGGFSTTHFASKKSTACKILGSGLLWRPIGLRLDPALKCFFSVVPFPSFEGLVLISTFSSLLSLGLFSNCICTWATLPLHKTDLINSYEINKEGYLIIITSD